MVANVIQSLDSDGLPLSDTVKKQKEGAMSAAEQFLQMFNNTVANELQQNSASLKQAGGVPMLGIMEKRQLSRPEPVKIEAATRPADNDRKQPGNSVNDRQAAETTRRNTTVETDARNRQQVEKADKSASVVSDKQVDESKSNRSDHAPVKEQSSAKEMPSRLPTAAPTATPAEEAGKQVSTEAQKSVAETQDRLQAAVRKAMFQKEDGGQKQETAAQQESSPRQSRLMAAVAQAEVNKAGSGTKSMAAHLQSSASAGASESAVQGMQQSQNGAMQNQMNLGQQAQQMISLQAVKPSAGAASEAGNQFTSALKAVQASSAKAQAGAQQQPGAVAGEQVKSQAATRMTDAEKLVRSRQAEIVKQVVRSARLVMKGGNQEMKMLLKPEELGWLKMRVSVQGQKVTAFITVENDNVRSMLEQNIGQLQTSLQNQNLRVNQIVVQVSGEQTANQAGDLLDGNDKPLDQQPQQQRGTSGNVQEDELENEDISEDVLAGTGTKGEAGVDMTI